MWFDSTMLHHLITHFKEVTIILLLESYGFAFLILPNSPLFFWKKAKQKNLQIQDNLKK